MEKANSQLIEKNSRLSEVKDKVLILKKFKQQKYKDLKSSVNKDLLKEFEATTKNQLEEINQLRTIVKTYEEHNLKIVDLEKKIRLQKVKHEKELKEIENYYKEKITSLSNKINNKYNKNFNNPINNSNTNKSQTYSLSPIRDKYSSTIEEKDKKKTPNGQIIKNRVLPLFIFK